MAGGVASRVKEQGALEEGGSRSRALERRTVLEGALSEDIAAGGYRSMGLERTVLEGELRGSRSWGLERILLEGKFSGDIAPGGY